MESTKKKEESPKGKKGKEKKVEKKDSRKIST
jgi:hypothetical protein